MWFSHATLRVDGQRVEVATDSPFVAKWIHTHFQAELRGIARETLGGAVAVEVRVEPDASARATVSPGVQTAEGRPGRQAPDPSRASADGPPPALSTSRRRKPAYRRRAVFRNLDQFVVGHSNRLAFSAACELARGGDSASVSPLFIHGDCGLGKTHLLQGICHRFAEISGRPQDIRYVTGEQFTNEYIASIRNNTIDAFRQRFRRLELLAIDDVHFLSNKVRTQSEFLHTLDAIDLSGARLVFASDEHPRLIQKFSQALISRFLSGMVVEVEHPDRDTRLAIVRQLAAARSLPINDAAVAAVASRCVGSVRELEGAVTKLAALRSLTDDLLQPGHTDPSGVPNNGMGTAKGSTGEVGLLLTEQLFRDLSWRPPTPVRLGTVLDVVCHQLGIARTDLMGSSRHRRVVLGRGLVAYLGREMTTHSYPEIARSLGRSYHSTIHTAEQRLRRQLEEKQIVEPSDGGRPLPLRELVDRLRHEITRTTAKP